MTLSGEMECEEVSIIAGHKGQPEVVTQERPTRTGTLAGEKPPVFDLIQRNTEGVLHMFEHVHQRTIKPILTKTIQLGSTIFTDEYNVYTA